MNDEKPRKPYQDPHDPGNGASYRTGKPCIEPGCMNPAGTWWSPLWCYPCNVERMDRIDDVFEVLAKYVMSAGEVYDLDDQEWTAQEMEARLTRLIVLRDEGEAMQTARDDGDAWWVAAWETFVMGGETYWRAVAGYRIEKTSVTRLAHAQEEGASHGESNEPDSGLTA